MSEIVSRIVSLIEYVVDGVPVGTNLGLLHLFLALLSGRLLNSRGALFPALNDLGLSAAAVRRAEAALGYGRWHINELIVAWQLLVLTEGVWQPRYHEGYCAVPCDLVGYFRPRLCDCKSKHYPSQSDKALPAIVLGMIGAVGSVGTLRLALPRAFVRAETADQSEKNLERRTLTKAGEELAPQEVVVADAGFSLAAVLSCEVARFVLRRDKNFTARHNYLPAYKGQGRYPDYGELVRPLSRCYADQYHAATRPDQIATWKVGKRRIRALLFEDLVLSDAKPGSPSFRCVVILDPKYKEPLVLATNLSVRAKALWCLYYDRWPIEQLPLAAKQRLGAERRFVFGQESRIRLPELSLLAGNLLS